MSNQKVDYTEVIDSSVVTPGSVDTTNNSKSNINPRPIVKLVTAFNNARKRVERKTKAHVDTDAGINTGANSEAEVDFVEEVIPDGAIDSDADSVENYSPIGSIPATLASSQDESLQSYDCKYRISGKFVEGYECGCMVFKYYLPCENFKVYYIQKKGSNHAESIRDYIKKKKAKNEIFRIIYKKLNHYKYNDNTLFYVYYFNYLVKMKPFDEKMAKKVKRQGWKDFILSLNSEVADSWKDKNVYFCTQEEGADEPVPRLDDGIDYSSITWTPTGAAKVFKKSTFFSKSKFISSQRIEGNDVKARYIQINEINEPKSFNSNFTINWINPRQVRIDEYIVVFDDAENIIRLFDLIMGKNKSSTNNPITKEDEKLKITLETYIKSTSVFNKKFLNLKILIIDPKG